MTTIREFIKKTFLAQKWLRRCAISYCTHNHLLHEVLLVSDSDSVREQLNLPPGETKSQLNQDVFALIVNRFRPGFFVEIGANDGYTLSNTNYLEKHFGWNGLLIEPNPKYSESLSCRKAAVCRKAVAQQPGRSSFIDAGLNGGLSATIAQAHSNIVKMAGTIEVETDTLANILGQFNAPKQIDFISIDVEGGELTIVEQLVGSTGHEFVCGCIEHGHHSLSDKMHMSAMLSRAGYKLMWTENSTQDLFFVNPRLTIMAAGATPEDEMFHGVVSG